MGFWDFFFCSFLGCWRFYGSRDILWLAWGMVRARDWGMGEESGEAAFSRGVLLQVTNGKTALFCITTLSTYVLPYTSSPLAASTPLRALSARVEPPGTNRTGL